MPVYPNNKSKLATNTMKTNILAATDKAFTPGNKNGAKAKPSSKAANIQASQVLRGRSFDNKRLNISECFL
jgi:hypothetical protein